MLLKEHKVYELHIYCHLVKSYKILTCMLLPRRYIWTRTFLEKALTPCGCTPSYPTTWYSTENSTNNAFLSCKITTPKDKKCEGVQAVLCTWTTVAVLQMSTNLPPSGSNQWGRTRPCHYAGQGPQPHQQQQQQCAAPRRPLGATLQH